MKIKEIIEKLNIELITGTKYIEKEVKGVYVSDLLSDVLANAIEGSLWITHQQHINVVAVAVAKELAGVLYANGRMPGLESVRKGIEEKMVLLRTDKSAYEIAGELYKLNLPSGLKKK